MMITMIEVIRALDPLVELIIYAKKNCLCACERYVLSSLQHLLIPVNTFFLTKAYLSDIFRIIQIRCFFL